MAAAAAAAKDGRFGASLVSLLWLAMAGTYKARLPCCVASTRALSWRLVLGRKSEQSTLDSNWVRQDTHREPHSPRERCRGVHRLHRRLHREHQRDTAMDAWTLGAFAACMLAAAAVPLLLRSWRPKAAGGEVAGGEAEAEVRKPSSESERAAKQTKKKRAKKVSSGGDVQLPVAEDETALATSLPVLAPGDRVWHKASNELVDVVKVHYEDPPPYYTVRTAAGLERSTIRTRLETVEERAAAAAAAELQAAEARAAAFAAELLAEEATKGQKGNRKPNSGRDKQTKKRS